MSRAGCMVSFELETQAGQEVCEWGEAVAGTLTSGAYTRPLFCST